MERNNRQYSREEMEQKELEEFEEMIRYLKPVLLTRRPAAVDHKRVNQMKCAWALLKLAMEEQAEQVTLTCAQHELMPGMGVIQMEGEELTFSHSGFFSDAVKLADNMEIYPLTDGRIRASLTFHGLLRPL